MYRRPIFLILALLLWSGTTFLSAAETKPPTPKDDYYELYKVLVDTVDQVDRNYVKEIDRRELIEAAIKGVMTRLDPYSTYIGPNELTQFRNNIENEFGGIGIHVSMQGGVLKVVSPMYGTPAHRAGILAGDQIVEIDGKATAGWTPDQAISRMKGAEGTAVALTVLHLGQTKPVKIALVREKIRVETVLGHHRKADDTWDYMLDPQNRIGYIQVTAFGRETTAELRTALKELHSQKMRGLILDLRFNPGGLLSAAIEVSNLFISQGRIVSTKGRNTAGKSWDARKEDAIEDAPMVVLVNHFSASASEIVSACLQDHNRAAIAGQRTWGKGSVQNVIELDQGRSALKLTTASFYRPSGKNIHRFPDSKDKDDWGVSPTPGLELKLDDREMLALQADRSEREVLRPKQPIATKAATRAAQTIKTPAFVDRQLEIAVKHLNGQLKETVLTQASPNIRPQDSKEQQPDATHP